MLLLSDLINGDPSAMTPNATSPVNILGLAADSRDVRPGFLFAAIAGEVADGRDYIPDAVGQGAVAVLAPPGTAIADTDIPLITDDNPRRRLAQMAARFFPKQPETVVAVTGTNGKTSVASFVEQIWRSLGHPAASVGTLGVHGDNLDAPLAHTTPEPVTLHRTLFDIAEKKIDHVAMEASSHGLAQYRLDGVRLTAAAFTNLTHDHLDYHADEDEYLAAKARLFAEVLKPGGHAVLNADSLAFPTLAEICIARSQHILSFGKAATDIRIVSLKPQSDGQQVYLQVKGRDHKFLLPLLGDFQIHNAACALGLVMACGADPELAVAALAKLHGIKGRIEKVAEHPGGAPIYIDYAHTPDALETVLQSLKPHVSNRLVVVFGCGGDRDQTKRRVMGEIASSHADQVIVTDDNPRGEDAAAIRKQVLAGCDGASEFGDRREAIEIAISTLAAGDLLVIAGKGHEQGQIIKDEVHPFDDATEARDAVAQIAGAKS